MWIILMCVRVFQQISGETNWCSYPYILYNVYQTKTNTASNLKRIKRKKEKLITEKGEGGGGGGETADAAGVPSRLILAADGGRRDAGGGRKDRKWSLGRLREEIQVEATPPWLRPGNVFSCHLFNLIFSSSFFAFLGISNTHKKTCSKKSSLGVLNMDTRGRSPCFLFFSFLCERFVFSVSGFCYRTDSCRRETWTGGAWGREREREWETERDRDRERERDGEANVWLCACDTVFAPLCNTCTLGIHVPRPGRGQRSLFALVCHWTCMPVCLCTSWEDWFHVCVCVSCRPGLVGPMLGD